jgi:hypothetical protein
LDAAGLYLTLNHRQDLYRELCERKWRHWDKRLLKWQPIRDWKKYVTALDEKIFDTLGSGRKADAAAPEIKPPAATPAAVHHAAVAEPPRAVAPATCLPEPAIIAPIKPAEMRQPFAVPAVAVMEPPKAAPRQHVEPSALEDNEVCRRRRSCTAYCPSFNNLCPGVRRGFLAMPKPPLQPKTTNKIMSETFHSSAFGRIVQRRHDSLVARNANPSLPAIQNELRMLDGLNMSEQEISEHLTGLDAGRRGTTGETEQAASASRRAAHASNHAETATTPEAHFDAQLAHAAAAGAARSLAEYHDQQRAYHAEKASAKPGTETPVESRASSPLCCARSLPSLLGDATVPTSILYLPKGLHRISPSQGGKPVTVVDGARNSGRMAGTDPAVDPVSHPTADLGLSN